MFKMFKTSSNGGLTWVEAGHPNVWTDCIGTVDVTAGVSIGSTQTPYTHPASVISAAREEATQAERKRILAALEKIAPMEQPYTRREWALEQKGAKEHHAKVLKAIGQ